jgi:L-iditol 2-dehydrogenase
LLVKVMAATTCGTDLKAFRRGHAQIPMPGPLGHEYSGLVEAARPGAGFEVGDAVMGVHSTKVLGAFAEYLLIPARIADLNVFLKPDKLSFEAAALLEPLSCVAQGILQLTLLGAIPTEHALVVGPGAIGLMFVVALLASGVQRVSLAGRNEARLAVGEKLGAEVGRWPDGLRFGRRVWSLQGEGVR